MFALSYDPSYSGPANLHSVDAATAVGTPVGTAPAPEDYGYANQPAWDPVTKTAFFVNYNTDTPRLATMNNSTGVLTAVANFTLAGERVAVHAIAISPTGVAYANSDGMLYSLNLADATLTLIAPTASDMYGFAFNPAGVLYGIDQSDRLYTINTDTGVPTLVTTFDFPNPYVPNAPGFSSIQFDSSGTLWMAVPISIGEGAIYSELWSADLTAIDPAASAVLTGAFTDPAANAPNSGAFIDEPYFYHQALLIVPSAVPAVTPTPPAVTPADPGVTPAVPVLAYTGTDLALPIGGLAGLLLTAGLIALGSARLLRRTK